MGTRDVRALFESKRIAIVGASDDRTKWGYWLSRGVAESDAEVTLVNRRGTPVLGRPTVPTLRDATSAPELVVLATPAGQFVAEIDNALEVGARAIIGITSGAFSDVAARRAVVERVRAAGAVLLGPNCMGIADTGRGIHLLWGQVPAGPIGLLSQSGNIALEIGSLAASVGLGLSRFASIGDQADLMSFDLLQAVAGAPETRVVALYVEDVKDGDAFGSTVARLTSSGMPVVLLAGGASVAGSRAASSHTGSMVTGDTVIDAVCRASGAIRVRTPGELVDVCSVLVADGRPDGPRIGVVGDGGGHGILASDAVERAGFDVPLLSTPLREKLAALLPGHASVSNPIDMAGGENDLTNYAALIEGVAGSGEVDAVLLTGYFGNYGSESEDRAAEEIEVASRITRARVESSVPVLVHTLAPYSSSSQRLRAGGVPVSGRVENVVKALQSVSAATPPHWPARQALRGAPPSGDAYWVAREMLVEAGVEFPEARLVSSVDAAADAAHLIGYPVAVKALGIAHKTEADAVKLNLNGREQVIRAAADILGRMPGHRLSVERMADTSDSLELIVGTQQDLRFGTVVLVGAGGIQAELSEDTSVAVGPLNEAEALRILDNLRVAQLFAGFRGRPPLNRRAAARAIVALSRLADSLRDEVAEIEMNPLLVTRDRAVALDAHLVRRQHGGL
jgi:acyl-CoA synthetase (NDP forming)